MVHTRVMTGVMATASQLSAHRADRVELSGRHGAVAALVAAPADATATVLMVPGYTGSKEDFAPLLDPIVDAGFAAVAIDQPGQYESHGPAEEHEYLPAALGDALSQLLPLLTPQPVVLLGHSYGGLVCRAAVLAGARVAGLVLMSSGPSALPDGPRRQTLDLAEPLMREHGVPAVQRLRELADGAVAPRPPELAALLRERFLRSTAAGLLGMATGLRTEPDRVPDLASALRHSGTPCLVTCGELDDAWSPEHQRDMASRLGAPFVPVPGAAHSPNVENPDGLLDLLIPTWRSWLRDIGR